jgi:hypothetical protein
MLERVGDVQIAVFGYKVMLSESISSEAVVMLSLDPNVALSSEAVVMLSLDPNVTLSSEIESVDLSGVKVVLPSVVVVMLSSSVESSMVESVGSSGGSLDFVSAGSSKYMDSIFFN